MWVEIFQVQSSVPVGFVWHFPTEEERGVIFLFKDLQVKHNVQTVHRETVRGGPPSLLRRLRDGGSTNRAQ